MGSEQQEQQEQQSVSLDDALGLGLKLHGDGHRSAAESVYRQILQAIPGQPDALHFLGLLLHQSGKANEAIELVRRAVSIEPSNADAHNNLGNLLSRQGQPEEAAAAYLRAIALAPNHAAAHNNLGVVLKERGDLESAIAAFNKAISIRPSYAEAHGNLGNALKRQGRFDAALAAYGQATALKPDYAEAHYNQGLLHADLEQHADAVAAFRKTIAIKPADSDAHFELANALVRQGLFEEALAGYRRALDHRPHYAKAHENLGNLLTALGRTAEAAGAWRLWLEKEPDNPIPRHMLAASTGQAVPHRAADDYVTRTFDGFASTFDERLKQLQYRASDLIGSAVASEFGAPENNLEVLDAGCGTGLCGPLLRPYARRLTGVDLSTGMIDKARQRAIYDELITGELTALLQASPKRYDLIVSADTLVYFGDLKPILGAFGDTLHPRGVLIFTLEDIGEDESTLGFCLNRFGRYCHGPQYVKDCLDEACFPVAAIQPATLRLQAGKPVAGLVVQARKLDPCQH